MVVKNVYLSRLLLGYLSILLSRLLVALNNFHMACSYDWDYYFAGRLFINYCYLIILSPDGMVCCLTISKQHFLKTLLINLHFYQRKIAQKTSIHPHCCPHNTSSRFSYIHPSQKHAYYYRIFENLNHSLHNTRFHLPIYQFWWSLVHSSLFFSFSWLNKFLDSNSSFDVSSWRNIIRF